MASNLLSPQRTFLLLLITTCFHLILGAALFQSYDSIPEFIAEKIDGKTRTILMRFGSIFGVHTVVGSEDDDEFHVTTITTNGLVLAKVDSDTEYVYGHTMDLDTIEKCYISADEETVQEFLYIFDAKFRTVDTSGIVFLMEIPESVVSQASDASSIMESSSGSHGVGDAFTSTGSSFNDSHVNLTPASEGWDEWNLRHGINQIPVHLQNTFDTILAVTDHCVETESRWKHVHTKLTEERIEPELTNNLNRARRTPGIYPGTVWCGIGDAATSYDDIGEHADTDICCREHDFCPNSISPFSSKFEYFNLRLYTINHCDCDTRLRQCFRDVNTTVSSSVAHLFFNTFSPVCFHLESYETCIAKTWWGNCNEYGTAERAVIRENLPWVN